MQRSHLRDYPRLESAYRQAFGKKLDIGNIRYQAQRLARTEINMAYRSAESSRWQELDFVVGYEVKRSQRNERRKVKDPKKSANAVTELPQGFKDWVKDNEGRIATASHRGTLPYFLRDNQGKWQNLVGATAQTQKLHSPPFVETYKAVHNGKVFISPYHGDEELDENLRVAKLYADMTNEKVYLLPNIDPMSPNAMELRAKYLPLNVPVGKNVDFLISGKLFELKSMTHEVYQGKTEEQYKKDIENRYKKAKKQSHNMIISIPEFVPINSIDRAMRSQLNRSKTERIVAIVHGESMVVYDNLGGSYRKRGN